VAGQLSLVEFKNLAREDPRMASIRILGDYSVSEHQKDVKIEELLGTRFEFKYISTISSLALELDPQGPEKITMICCMNSVLEEILGCSQDADLQREFGRLRVIFDAYLSRNHEIYYCPPIGRSTTQVTRVYLDMMNRLNVSTY
jgi:hypothetical protein